MTQQIDCGADRVYNPKTGKCVKKTGKVGKDLLKQGKGRRYAECGGVVVKDAKGVPYCKKPRQSSASTGSTSKGSSTSKAAASKAVSKATTNAALSRRDADTALHKLRLIRETLRLRDRHIVELQDDLIRCRSERDAKTPASRLSQADVNALLRMAGGARQGATQGVARQGPRSAR